MYLVINVIAIIPLFLMKILFSDFISFDSVSHCRVGTMESEVFEISLGAGLVERNPTKIRTCQRG